MQRRLGAFKRKHREGVVFIGVAQEKARVPRTVRKAFGHDGGTIPWINYSTANVNFYYFYCLDQEFGPFFIKFCSYFPYTAKLCINGHEYLKRQLERRAIAYQALDNGIWWTEQLRAAQRICDRFDQQKIDAFFRKWLRRLPHPFSHEDRQAGYRYDLSILQAEFSLTQIWDRPLNGRCFFEEVIRENIDLLYLTVFRKEFAKLAGNGPDEDQDQDRRRSIPWGITGIHLLFLSWTVVNAHYPVLVILGLLFFLAFVSATRLYQHAIAHSRHYSSASSSSL
jgi:hypothetical protein